MESKEEFAQKILKSLDGLQKAETDPFFETRVFAAIEKQRETAWFSLRPGFSRFALGALLILVVLNIFSLMKTRTATGQSSGTDLSAVKKEYFSYTEYNF
jgi:hypothetical protein